MNSLASICCLLLLFSTSVIASPCSEDLTDTSLKRKYYADLPSSSSTPTFTDDLDITAILATFTESTISGLDNCVGTGNGHIHLEQHELCPRKEPQPCRKFANPSTEQLHQPSSNRPAPSDLAMAQAQQDRFPSRHRRLILAKSQRKYRAKKKAALAAGPTHPIFFKTQAQATKEREYQHNYQQDYRARKRAEEEAARVAGTTDPILLEAVVCEIRGQIYEQQNGSQLQHCSTEKSGHLQQISRFGTSNTPQPFTLTFAEHLEPPFSNQPPAFTFQTGPSTTQSQLRSMAKSGLKEIPGFGAGNELQPFLFSFAEHLQQLSSDQPPAFMPTFQTGPSTTQSQHWSTATSGHVLMEIPEFGPSDKPAMFTIPGSTEQSQPSRACPIDVIMHGAAIESHNNAEVWPMLEENLPIDCNTRLVTSVCNGDMNSMHDILQTNGLSSHLTLDALDLALQAAKSNSDAKTIENLYGFMIDENLKDI